jgi:hypothetical protein
MTIAYNNQNFSKYQIEAFYHMTHIDNISSILKNGLLAHGNGFQKRDISDHAVNDRRSKLERVYWKPVHSYVPFYFNPKNAMLYRRKEMQEDIVILVFSKNLINEQGAIFTDGNASSDATRFFNKLEDLKQLNWNCLNDRSWYNHNDGRRVRMAEVLVPNCVGVEKLEKIVCCSHKTYARLKQIVPAHIDVELDRKFYF